MAQVLQRFGKRVVPVHPKAETVHGERGYASLADIPFEVDVVDPSEFESVLRFVGVRV